MKVIPTIWYRLPEENENGMGVLECKLPTDVGEIPIPVETNDIAAEEIATDEPFDFDFALEGGPGPDASEFRIFADEDDFAARGNTSMASESLIPVGLFTPDGKLRERPMATILLYGKVTYVMDAAQKAELGYGEKDTLYTVSSLGCEFDCIVPEEEADLSAMQVGNIVRGIYWVEGYRSEE